MYTTINEQELIVNGIPLRILISWSYDDVDPSGDFDFGDEQENEKYLARFESGELLMLTVRVSAYLPGLSMEGSDSLGACHIRAANLEEDIMERVREHEMIDNAADELLHELKQASELFQQLMEG